MGGFFFKKILTLREERKYIVWIKIFITELGVVPSIVDPIAL
jgi:hypothetical protein